MSTIIYGIKNCDTMKKAIKWLEHEHCRFEFHDYRKAGIDEHMVVTFINKLGLESLINKRGTTFRALPKEVKKSLTEQSAIALMLENPAMIKRPILKHEGRYYLGFSTEEYQKIFNNKS